ncbi:9041_t:CDS:2, partial [Scutellospora calospora]
MALKTHGTFIIWDLFTHSAWSEETVFRIDSLASSNRQLHQKQHASFKSKALLSHTLSNVIHGTSSFKHSVSLGLIRSLRISSSRMSIATTSESVSQGRSDSADPRPSIAAVSFMDLRRDDTLTGRKDILKARYHAGDNIQRLWTVANRFFGWASLLQNIQFDRCGRSIVLSSTCIHGGIGELEEIQMSKSRPRPAD